MGLLMDTASTAEDLAHLDATSPYLSGGNTGVV